MDIKIENQQKPELLARQVKDWPVWGCEPSAFAWHYDRQEQCSILEGEVTVKKGDGEVTIRSGDSVTSPQGPDCVWTVRKPVRKHYFFA